jgi:hypothetical protein
MKTHLFENLISSKELFFIYSQVMSIPSWQINGISDNKESSFNNKFNSAPILVVKTSDNANPSQYSFYLWGKTVVFRIEKELAKQNIGIPVSIDRMWFNVTYTDNNQHWLHRDSNQDNVKSIVLFLTPVWSPEWKGSFHVDGEEFKFKPGSAVIFDSKEYHTGKTPAEKTYGWSRLTCNILIK